MNPREGKAAAPPASAIEPTLRSLLGYRPFMGYVVGTFVLIGAVWLVYHRAIEAPFIFDDIPNVMGNTSIVELWPLVDGTGRPSPLNPERDLSTSGRPLVNLSLAINYRIGQLDPAGYHVFNIVVHILSALLLWMIVRRVLRLQYFQATFDGISGPLAFLCALVWALHPLQTETVVYVTQRTELVMAFCYLATLYGSLRYWAAESPAARAAWVALATLACLMGMASKEVMVTAPVVILLFEDIFIARSLRQALRDSWPLYLGLFSTWGLLLALNYNGPRSESAGFRMGVPVLTWWFLQAKVFWLYVKLAFWPWPLAIHYHLEYLTLAEAWPWLLALGAFAVASFVFFWRLSTLGFVGVSMLAILSPTHVVPMIAEAAAERRMYLPLAALVPLVVAGGYALARWACGRFGRPVPTGRTDSTPVTITIVGALAVAAVFSFLDVRRVALYGDELALWQDAETRDPHDPVVHVFEGLVLNKAGRSVEALDHFEKAVRMDPDSFLAQYNLARALEQGNRPNEALGRYEEALRLNPKSAAAHHHLGDVLTNSGDKQRAIEHYRQAIALNADFTEAHSNLGIVLFDSGQIDAAIEQFVEAARLKPTIAAYRNLALAYSKANRPADAVATAVKARDLARSQGQNVVAGEIEAWLKSQQPRQ